MDIFKKINRERNISGAVIGMCAAGILLLVGILLKCILFFMEIPFDGFDFLTVLFSVIIFTAFFFLRRGGRNKAATKLDSITDSANRLECAVELKNTSHPLKNAQAHDCLNFFSKNTIPLRPFRLLLPTAIVIILFCFLTSIPEYRRSENILEKKKTPAITAKQNNEDKKKIEEPAEITFTAPESEMRAKPMDEISFEGNASSPCGFSEISLKISVNAVLKKTIKVECDNMDKSGKLDFSGEFYLDELDVNPFDLVTYHLEAYSSNDKDKSTPVMSLPQFIEVRPFREDAFLAGAGSGNLAKQKALLDMLIKFLNNQIVLNKSSYLAKAAVSRIENKVLAQELAAVATAQEALYDEITEFTNDIDPKSIPANTFYCIKQAAENMHQAKEQLEKITRSFDKDIQLEKKDK